MPGKRGVHQTSDYQHQNDNIQANPNAQQKAREKRLPLAEAFQVLLAKSGEDISERFPMDLESNEIDLL